MVHAIDQMDDMWYRPVPIPKSLLDVSVYTFNGRRPPSHPVRRPNTRTHPLADVMLGAVTTPYNPSGSSHKLPIRERIEARVGRSLGGVGRRAPRGGVDTT